MLGISTGLVPSLLLIGAAAAAACRINCKRPAVVETATEPSYESCSLGGGPPSA